MAFFLVENNNNRLIKGMWRLTGMRSSDFIALVQYVNPDLTGARIRGLMSGVDNRNFRKAEPWDVARCVNAIAVWVDLDIRLLKMTGAEVEVMLSYVDAILCKEVGGVLGTVPSSAERKLLVKQAFEKVTERSGFSKKKVFF